MQSGTKQRAIVFLLAVTFAPGVVRAQAPQSSQRSTSVPAAVYSRLFREVVNFGAKADRLEAQGRSDASVRHHHQIWLRLTAGQEAELKQVAADWARQNASLDVQASAARSTLQRLRRESSSAVVASQERGLAAIAAQQVALAQSQRGALAKAFGPGAFAYFESVLRRYSVTPDSATSVSVRPLAACPNCQELPDGEETSPNSPNWIWDGVNFGGFYLVAVDGGSEWADHNVYEDVGNANDLCFTMFENTPFAGATIGTGAGDYQAEAALNADGAYADRIGVTGGQGLYWLAWYETATAAYSTLCGYTATQVMSIDGFCFGPAQDYKTNSLSFAIINGYSFESNRDGVPIGH